jgi:hypothetical protein
MTRPQTILWLAFIAGALMSSIALAAPTMHQGKVAGVGKAEIMVLDTKDGEAETFVVESATKITVDGKAAKLVDVQVGFVVEISAETNQDGKLIAKTITAASKISPER